MYRFFAKCKINYKKISKNISFYFSHGSIIAQVLLHLFNDLEEKS